MATGIVKLSDAEENQEKGGGNNPRAYSPSRDGSGSPALYAAQRVVPIPSRLVIETARYSGANGTSFVTFAFAAPALA
jgi:hypothetical protein